MSPPEGRTRAVSEERSAAQGQHACVPARAREAAIRLLELPPSAAERGNMWATPETGEEVSGTKEKVRWSTGKPDQNAYIERFNRSYRTEVLNAHLFESVAELQALSSTWLRIYNGERPHDSLGRVPPLTFLPRPSSAEKSPIELSA